MKITYAFRRDHPFGLDAPFELLDAYRRELADALRGQYPDCDVDVTSYDGGLFDVMFEPEELLTADERFRIAVDVTHEAHRIAHAMIAESADARVERAVRRQSS